MQYQAMTPAEAVRLVRSLIYHLGPEGLADMAADACDAEGMEAQETGATCEVVGELQRGAHHFAEAAACMQGDTCTVHALAAAAKN